MEKSCPKYDTCFFERYAKALLAMVLGGQYNALVNRDRPDLQTDDNTLGIEVTRAMLPSKSEASSMLNELAQRRIIDDTDAPAKRPHYTYGLANSSTIGTQEYDYWRLASTLPNVLENKVKKVQNGFYGHFSTFELFVYTRQTMHKEDILNAISLVLHQQGNAAPRFSTLFIFDISTLWQCDITSMHIIQHHISPVMCRTFFDIAIGLKD